MAALQQHSEPNMPPRLLQGPQHSHSHCFLSIDAASGCWRGERLSCFVDGRTETWGECSKRIVEREVTGVPGLLLRLLAAICPKKRLSVYRLRYGNGFNTIINVRWQEGGINSEAPLENSYVETIVSVVPIPKFRQNLKYTEPDVSVLSGLESMDSLNKGAINCSLEWRLLAIDESPLRATAEKCHVIDIAEGGDIGVDDGCTIEQTTLEEVNNLLARIRCVNFPNATVSDEDERKEKVENPLKRKSRVEAGPVEVDVSGQRTEANNEKPAAKPAVAIKRVKSNKKGKVRDPNRPKAPLTAFNLFAKSRREKIKTSNPDKNFNEISALVGKAWKALADDERKQFFDDAAAERAEYKEAMTRYNGSKSD